MSNTGKKIVLTLKQIDSHTFVPTGLTKVNDPSDPDYIPPSTDLIECPVSFSFSCPLIITTGFTGSIGFEFSLFDSVVMNSQVSSVKFNAISASLVQGSSSFTLPNATPNYFSGSIGSLHSGSYSSSIQYMSGSSVLSTCLYTSSIIVF